VERRDARLLEEAQGYLELELPAPALLALDRLTPAARDSFEGLMVRGTALMAQKKCDEAILPLLQAKELNAKAIPALVALGWCYKRTNQLPRAIAELHLAERVAKQRRDDPSRALATYNLACYYSLARRKPETLHWLELALAADPKYGKLAAAEADFAPFQADPAFQALLQGIAAK
jgi:tetratricopeptide (TPR) repeat protein